MMAVYDPDDEPGFDGPTRSFGLVASIVFLLAAAFIVWLLAGW